LFFCIFQTTPFWSFTRHDSGHYLATFKAMTTASTMILECEGYLDGQ
jgi:hypothetical protein